MKAMILAAGRGERMRPLTNTTPKPLLKIAHKALIEYHLENLKKSGIHEVVINVAYLGEKIIDFLNDGSQWGLNIKFSIEPEPLETAGAIHHAKSLLGDEPFILVNGDVWTDYPLKNLLARNLKDKLGHLVLVNNPEHHLEGDFSIAENNLLAKRTASAFTFSGISLLDPSLIYQYPELRTKFPLVEVFNFAIEKKLLSAERYTGNWCDVGTVERLEQLENQLTG